MYKKWIAWILCLSMVLSLWACGGNTDSTESTTTTEATSESTTEQTEDALALFNSAKDALLAADYLTLSIKKEDHRTVGAETRFRTETVTAKYSGLQGDLLSDVATEFTYGYADMETSKYFYAEKFVDGTVYATYKDAKYQEEISAEDYMSRQIPVCLFDASNFANATVENGATLTFTDATVLESWVAPDYAELISAEATATVADGSFTKMTYDATFRQGAADVTVSYEVSVNTKTEVSLSAEAPANADSHYPVEHVNLLPIVDQCYYNTLIAKAKNGQIMQIVTSQAAGYAMQTTTTLGEYDADGDYYGRMHSTYLEVTQNGQTNAETEELFNNGKYSYYYDGELSDERELGTAIFKEAIFTSLSEYLIYGNELTEATVSQVGDGYLVEFETERQDTADAFKEAVTGEIFEDTATLDNLASAYEHQGLKGYMGLDMDTLCLTSYGVEFQGVHTIEGAPYLLSLQRYCSYTVPSTEVYEEITEEALPETEPSEKANPVFYHVTGENGEEMWLLGTFHLGDERTGFLPQEIYDAFDASDALAVEYDINAAEDAMEEDEALALKIASLMVYGDGSTAGDYLYTDTYEEAMRHLKYTGEYIPTVEMMKIAVWQNSLSNAMLKGHRSLTASKGVDQRLLDRAEAADKEILNVESLESQMAMLTGFSNELQEYLLKETLAMPRHEYVSGIEDLYELWCSGDEAALREYLKSEDEAPEDAALLQEYQDALLTNRDKGMMETAKGYLTGGKTVFYAVGLAHLLSENGLVDSLRAAGYTVELVSFAN